MYEGQAYTCLSWMLCCEGCVKRLNFSLHPYFNGHKFFFIIIIFLILAKSCGIFWQKHKFDLMFSEFVVKSVVRLELCIEDRQKVILTKTLYYRSQPIGHIFQLLLRCDTAMKNIWLSVFSAYDNVQVSLLLCMCYEIFCSTDSQSMRRWDIIYRFAKYEEMRYYCVSAAPLEAFGRVAWHLLQDVQERLVFRAHCYLQSDILQYKPAAGDLAYPEKLEMMEVQSQAFLQYFT